MRYASFGVPLAASVAFTTTVENQIAVREFVDKSAVCAASLDYVKFQAVIKSAASAASPKAKSREGGSREVPRGRRPPAEAVVLHFPGAPFP